MRIDDAAVVAWVRERVRERAEQSMRGGYHVELELLFMELLGDPATDAAAERMRRDYYAGLNDD